MYDKKDNKKINTLNACNDIFNIYEYGKTSSNQNRNKREQHPYILKQYIRNFPY